MYHGSSNTFWLKQAFFWCLGWLNTCFFTLAVLWNYNQIICRIDQNIKGKICSFLQNLGHHSLRNVKCCTCWCEPDKDGFLVSVQSQKKECSRNALCSISCNASCHWCSVICSALNWMWTSHFRLQLYIAGWKGKQSPRGSSIKISL